MTFPSVLRPDCDALDKWSGRFLHKTGEEMPQTLDRAVESGSIYASKQLSSFDNLNDRIE